MATLSDYLLGTAIGNHIVEILLKFKKKISDECSVQSPTVFNMIIHVHLNKNLEGVRGLWHSSMCVNPQNKELRGL